MGISFSVSQFSNNKNELEKKSTFTISSTAWRYWKAKEGTGEPDKRKPKQKNGNRGSNWKIGNYWWIKKKGPTAIEGIGKL